jgi:hypothetical protein
MSERKRKALIVQRASAVPETPCDWQNSVAGALCMLAVGQWARDYETHLALAAGAYDACCNGFLNVEVTEAARKELLTTIKECAKRNGKR